MIYILEIVVREECEHVAYSDPTWKTKKKKKKFVLKVCWNLTRNCHYNFW